MKTANGKILSNIRISVSSKLLVFSSQHHRVVIVLLASRRGCYVSYMLCAIESPGLQGGIFKHRCRIGSDFHGEPGRAGIGFFVFMR